jgi:hypothetical protein
MSQRTVRAGVGLAALAVALTATVVARADGGERPPTAVAPGRLTLTSDVQAGTVQPGGAVTGSITITNPGAAPRQVTDVVFAPATSDACARTGLALAATVAPTPESPLEVPAGGTAVVGWTAYLDGDGEHACQGSTLTSEVVLDGERAGTVALPAGSLPQPPSPTGGLTTSTRAAVHWSASPAAHPGWVVERARAGTDDWQPACGSSPAHPVRALSCTDTGLTRSTAYAYRVTLRTGHWHMTSRPSAPVRTQDRPSA